MYTHTDTSTEHYGYLLRTLLLIRIPKIVYLRSIRELPANLIKLRRKNTHCPRRRRTPPRGGSPSEVESRFHLGGGPPQGGGHFTSETDPPNSIWIKTLAKIKMGGSPSEVESRFHLGDRPPARWNRDSTSETDPPKGGVAQRGGKLVYL